MILILPIYFQQTNVPQKEWTEFEMTAYTAFCNTGCIGITRTGYDVSNTIYYDGLRVIAVDPEVIPLYSVVEIHTGTEVFKAIALDTGGLIKGNIIDLLVETKSEAYQWGRREVKVRVIE